MTDRSGGARAATRARVQRDRRQSSTSLLGLIEDVYPDPEAFTSAEAFVRAHHDDLCLLTAENLDRERILARFRWALDHAPSPWLVERLARLEREVSRRRGRR